MLTFDDLLAPITSSQFDAEYNDRKPLHIPAGAAGSKRSLLDWRGFNALLDQESIWTSSTLKLLFDGETVPADQYCTVVKTQAGTITRPVAGRVQALLSKGASLIAGDVHGLTPGLRNLAQSLSERFAAQVGANIYCSFGGVQAFNTHFDLHHVFAVQVEGEKVWRLYSNRADSPVAYPGEDANVRAWFAATRGPVTQEVPMRPGDVLYLPRGWYHDALTTDGSSLHVTFSVTPLYGRILFGLLESAAMQDPAFRSWLRPASEGGGGPLRTQLADLGRRLAELTTLREFADEVAMAQEQLVPRASPYTLPERAPLTVYRATNLAPPQVEGPARVAIEWAMGQPQVTLEDMVAQFDFIAPDALRQAVALAERSGALKRL